jgi:hypothetical protein
MKIAVIGSGPLALYASSHFYNIGAHVVLFQRSPLGGNVRFSLKYDLQSDVDYPSKKSIKKFWEEDLIPLIEFVEDKQISKVGDVLRVHKRFLGKHENVKNRSRLVDLFRVIYSTNPKDSILKQVEENPEIFKRLGDKVLDSLHEPVESFEDFDLVIEATGLGKTDFKMGPSGNFALNEKNLIKQSSFYYGKIFFSDCDLKSISKIVLVGSSPLAGLVLNKLNDWLFEKDDNRIFWVFTEEPTHNKELIGKLHQKAEVDFNIKKEKFENELRSWRDLADFEKAKIAKPIEPEEKLSLFHGYTVTSVDKLLDQNELYITIEKPEFRLSKSHGVDAFEMKTLASDVVVVQNGFNLDESVGEQLNLIEPGYYRLTSTTISAGVSEILKIEKDIMNYFSSSDQ